MRILFVTETYPPEINGVAMTTERMVRGLRERGHWVGVVRPRQGIEATDADTWTVTGLPIPKYPGLHLGLPAWRRLGHVLDTQRPDLVHIVTEGPLGWAALWAARSRGLPMTSGYHTHFDQYSGHYGLAWLMPWVTDWLDALHRRCQATLAPTPELAAALNARGIPNARAVGRGVDTRLFHPERRDAALRARWNLETDALACLYVGRLAPEKNLEVVERAFAAIAAHHRGARMVWVGDGPTLPRLRAAHPDHMFAGPRVGEDLAAHYASADLFLFGSLSETWGNVIGEALASGLGVVAYRRAAGEKLIREGENGISVPAGDAPAFVSAAVALAGDAPLRQRLGQQASLSMRAHGWEAIVERFEAALLEAARP
ncbi:MAG: glycosyltransferase family 1 protein [Pseudomonadota bacterium]|nr:glycosyltransferase family 1 protein [Pseudomonadota bacterium]MDP1902633.1 glycosyltransferase family 1 protein [Pseudomonadota bacterium]MDP2351953.1 glycosyltransferase family 1 protein [Pseudomonadota bacterium]